MWWDEILNGGKRDFIKSYYKIFDNLKPLILKDAYVKIKAAIDDNLALVVGDSLIPNSISPIDNAIAEARKQVRAKR